MQERHDGCKLISREHQPADFTVPVWKCGHADERLWFLAAWCCDFSGGQSPTLFLKLNSINLKNVRKDKIVADNTTLRRELQREGYSKEEVYFNRVNHDLIAKRRRRLDAE